jgi:hypothetical protein
MESSAEENLMAIIRLRDAFHPHAALVWAYAELFGVVPFRAKARKLRVILEEMKRLFDAEGFAYNRAVYRISRSGIAEALGVVVKRNFADRLENHNYLKKIMIGIAEREDREAGRQAERNLRAREDGMMSGDRYPVPEEIVAVPPLKDMPPAHLTEEQIAANKRRLKEMIKQIG